MKQKTVKILGEEVKIMFCMAVVCMYERANGVAFDPDNIKDNYDSTKLYAAAIAALNPDTKITLDDLMYKATGPEIAALRSAIIESMTEWYQVNSEVMPKQPNNKPEDDGEEKPEPPTFEESQGEKN
jgi:hypothetical protein